MSIFNRIVLAGLVCAGLAGIQPAMAQNSAGDANTRGRFVHASRCLATLGFSSGCDKDAPAPKPAGHAALTSASNDADGSTRHQFIRASTCVVTMGLRGGCDKDAPEHPSAASSPRVETGPDASTRARLMHASKCLATLGFSGDCDKK